MTWLYLAHPRARGKEGERDTEREKRERRDGDGANEVTTPGERNGAKGLKLPSNGPTLKEVLSIYVVPTCACNVSGLTSKNWKLY